MRFFALSFIKLVLLGQHMTITPVKSLDLNHFLILDRIAKSWTICTGIYKEFSPPSFRRMSYFFRSRYRAGNIRRSACSWRQPRIFSGCRGGRPCRRGTRTQSYCHRPTRGTRDLPSISFHRSLDQGSAIWFLKIIIKLIQEKNLSDPKA